MSTEENKAIMRRAMEEVLSEGNLDLIDELVSPDFVNHEPFPGLPPTREGVKQNIAIVREAFPDIDATIEDMIAEGDQIVSRYTLRGTHEGEFMGVPSTGKEVAWSAIIIFRVADGKITDQWLEQDRLGLMEQLDVVSPPGG